MTENIENDRKGRHWDMGPMIAQCQWSQTQETTTVGEYFEADSGLAFTCTIQGLNVEGTMTYMAVGLLAHKSGQVVFSRRLVAHEAMAALRAIGVLLSPFANRTQP